MLSTQDSAREVALRFAKRVWERPQRGFWILRFDSKNTVMSRTWNEDWDDAQKSALEGSKQEGIRRVQINDRTNMPLRAFVNGRRLGSVQPSGVALRYATKTDSEKEDEEAERLVRTSPKKKPPRRDLERNRVQETDKDPDKEADKRDRSHNYKHNGSLIRRVALRYLAADEEHKNGDSWESDDGNWIGKNPKGNTHSFGKAEGAKDKAKAYAEGKELGADSDDKGSSKAELFFSKLKKNEMKAAFSYLAALGPRSAFSNLADDKPLPAPVLDTLKRMGIPEDLFENVGAARKLLDKRSEFESGLFTPKEPKKEPVKEEKPGPQESPKIEEKPKESKPPEKPKTPEDEDKRAKSLLSGAGVGSYDLDLDDKSEEFHDLLMSSIDSELGKISVKSALKDGAKAAELDASLKDAEKFFDDFKDSDDLDPKVLAKHLAAMSAKKEIAAILKDSESKFKESFKDSDRSALSTVSNALENMGPMDRIGAYAALQSVLKDYKIPSLKGKTLSDEEAKNIDDSLNESDEFFEELDNRESDDDSALDLGEIAKHLARSSVKKELEKQSKDAEKALKAATKSFDPGAVRTVSSLTDNMGVAQKAAFQKSLVAALSSKELRSIKDGVHDEEDARQLDKNLAEAESALEELSNREENDDSPLDIDAIAKHLATTSVKTALSKMTKSSEEQIKKHLSGLGKEISGNISSVLDNLGPAGKIVFAEKLPEILKEAEKFTGLPEDASDEDKRKFQNNLEKSQEFFNERHEDPITPGVLLEHVRTVQQAAFAEHPLNKFKVPDSPEAKNPVANAESEDKTLKEDADAVLDKAREAATEQAHKAFKMYSEGTKELRDADMGHLQKEIDSLPPNSVRRIQAEGVLRGLTVAKVLTEGEDAIAVSPAFATLVKAAHKNNEMDVLLNVHKKHPSGIELDQKMQEDINHVLDMVDDDDWPDMIGEDHPLHKMALALTDLDNHLSPSMRASIRQELKDSVKFGLMVVDPVHMADNPDATTGDLRSMSDEALSEFAGGEGLDSLVEEGTKNPTDGIWAKLKAALANLRKNMAEWAAKKHESIKSKVKKVKQKGREVALSTGLNLSTGFKPRNPEPAAIARKAMEQIMIRRVAARHSLK